ncbi:hypothetical protein NQ318_023426 [Aromia moschata]|uniref:Mos1 transposase HTH domain-containing protein n=1 Tax=Aromia moschata TaxID=1265417 RepID=A0AAV8YTN6_9CUCU|nr:hypothetical protein NQ318_023426 [Aromia moschata]
MQRSLEQRMAIKFCVKLEKSAAETIPMLKKAFGVDCISDRQIFRLHKAFAEGREDQDQRREPRWTAINLQFRRQCETHYENYCSRNCIGVFRNEEGVREARAKVLTDDQKARRVETYQELLDTCEDNRAFLDDVITGDESWNGTRRWKVRNGTRRTPLAPRRPGCPGQRSRQC